MDDILRKRELYIERGDGFLAQSVGAKQKKKNEHKTGTCCVFVCVCFEEGR